VPLEEAIGRIAGVAPIQGRMCPIEHGGITFVQDTIKGAVWAFDAMFEFLEEARASRKVLVCGMLSDYPGSSSDTYRKVARRALTVADEVIFVGPRAAHVRKVGAPPERLRAIETVREAHEYLSGSLRPGDLVVLKGRNFKDHLARIALAYDGEVACWRNDCGRLRNCESCSLLR
jgi:UDP-N-acetylmuramoyl-tripeptide--D-alanyl-D-alanine ligase